jgi:hypothetical protein
MPTANLVRNSWNRSGGGAMLLLVLFNGWFPYPSSKNSVTFPDAPMLRSLMRGIGKKSKGSGYRLQGI